MHQRKYKPVEPTGTTKPISNSPSFIDSTFYFKGRIQFIRNWIPLEMQNGTGHEEFAEET